MEIFALVGLAVVVGCIVHAWRELRRSVNRNRPNDRGNELDSTNSKAHD